WQYRVDLKPSAQAAAGAHVSWVNEEMGLLMLDDVLPSIGDRPIRVEVKVRPLPQAWNLFTACRVTKEGVYVPTDLHKTSFMICRNWREKESIAKGSRLNVLTDGSWQFSDDDALRLALEVFSSYSKDLGLAAAKKYQIAAAKFPINV